MLQDRHMNPTCKLCHLGTLKQDKGTWARLVGTNLVILPDVKVLVCDVCGQVDYDPAVMIGVVTLLRHGKPTNRGKHALTPGQEASEKMPRRQQNFNL